MKALYTQILLAAALTAAGTATAHAADVGVSLQISQPGVYGRIDLGRYPQPQVVLQQPVIIGRPVVAAPEPVYLWVPPGHRRDWRHHCAEYRACGLPVYFVQDRWYAEHVRPEGHDRDGRHEGEHGGWHEDRRDEGHGHREGRRD